MTAADLMGRQKMDELVAIQEAAAAGVRSLEHLVFQLSRQSSPSDCREITDLTVSKFRKVISVLDRTGHARFRRGPMLAATDATEDESLSLLPKPFESQPQPNPPVASKGLTMDFTEAKGEPAATTLSLGFSASTTMSSGNSSFLSSLTGDGSVTDGKMGPAVLSEALVLASAAVSVGKPPLSSSHKRKSPGDSHDRVHCDENSGEEDDDSRAGDKLQERGHTIRRVLVAEVRAEAHQGLPLSQCSSMRGCPARKHVERAPDDPSMLILTYEGEHRHTSNPPDDFCRFLGGNELHSTLRLRSGGESKRHCRPAFDQLLRSKNVSSWKDASTRCGPPRVEVLAQGPDAVLGDLLGRRAHERLPSTRRLRSLARHAMESWRTLMSTGEGESGGT
ncbi:hypothetical protein BHE74_00054240 [Ensete ventricosum]|nr:hypothetical protein BHE74_00054240 [Ensete ventricosum]